MNLRILPALLGLSAFAAGEAPDPLAKYRPDWPTPIRPDPSWVIAPAPRSGSAAPRARPRCA